MVEERSVWTDKAEIHEAVLRYCRGIDRLDLDLVRSAFHPDGVDHHTGFDGSIDDFAAWVGKGLRHLDGTMHIVGNHLAEIEGDHAVAETYATAVHWGTPAGVEALNFTTGVRYVDHFERREGRWAIAERWAIREWIRPGGVVGVPTEGGGPTGRRDGEDPVQRLLNALRDYSGGSEKWSM